MAIEVTLVGEIVLVVNLYALSVKNERESMFESLLLFLQVYTGPMFVRGDLYCTLGLRLDGSYKKS